MKDSKKLYLAALVPFALIALLFELLPVAATVVRSFTAEGGGLTLGHYAAVFGKRLYRTALVNSLWVSILSSLIGLFVAFWGAKAYKSAGSKLRNLFLSVLNMTSNFSGIPLAFSYIILFGNVGVMVMFGKNHGIDALASFNIYSIWGLLLCYVYFQIPLATLLLIPAFDGLKKEWREAVALLGGGEAVYWFKVGLPNLLPSILGTFSVLFANAVAAYATAYALMQNNFALLPIKISEQFIGDVVQRREFGSALAVVLMLLMTATIWINDKILKMRTKKAK
ncbi:ABC transporter permease subunit [Cloacibacillus sp. An23]|uniref:ABC transporter permease n=1 Tax=Cloacibacillus sp. An23 TaxID=1965591 RepID=UPI000B3955E6|nr:ABC transporter permease subunit [Cloacibacillus sp. An23]OUO92851.1 ABC transporter permease [Cloacibacillus sp. An23]